MERCDRSDKNLNSLQQRAVCVVSGSRSALMNRCGTSLQDCNVEARFKNVRSAVMPPPSSDVKFFVPPWPQLAEGHWRGGGRLAPWPMVLARALHMTSFSLHMTSFSRPYPGCLPALLLHASGWTPSATRWTPQWQTWGLYLRWSNKLMKHF